VLGTLYELYLDLSETRKAPAPAALLPELEALLVTAHRGLGQQAGAGARADEMRHSSSGLLSVDVDASQAGAGAEATDLERALEYAHSTWPASNGRARLNKGKGRAGGRGRSGGAQTPTHRAGQSAATAPSQPMEEAEWDGDEEDGLVSSGSQLKRKLSGSVAEGSAGE
jgi:hypothetical protein